LLLLVVVVVDVVAAGVVVVAGTAAASSRHCRQKLMKRELWKDSGREMIASSNLIPTESEEMKYSYSIHSMPMSIY
jgi:hypothetical protein